MEEQIFKSQQILQQQLQPGKAKRQKLDNTMKTTSLEFSSPLPDNNSPISGVVDQPLLELANYQQATDDNTERESEKSSRLKPLSRKLRRQEHWKRRLLLSKSLSPSVAEANSSTNVTPIAITQQQYANARSVNVNDLLRYTPTDTVSSKQWCQSTSVATNNLISKHAVMEFYLKEKLRESSLREFEMFLKTN